jgi:outer membrane protein
MFRVTSIATFALLATATTPLMAADLLGRQAPPTFKAASDVPLSWYVHVGAGALILSESAKMTAGGAALPGASIKIDPQFTPIVEVGYFVTPNVAVSLTGGLPPRIDVLGKGAIAGLGTLGKAVYGPATLTAHYHFTNLGRFQPYVGAGLAYMKVFSTKDRVLTNIEMQDTYGPVLQAGFDVMINRHWGAFFDVKKAFLRTKATGTLGGAPINAKVVLDPLVIHSGLTYRF